MKISEEVLDLGLAEFEETMRSMILKSLLQNAVNFII